MAELTDIREALAASIDGIGGMQVSAWWHPNPSPPSAHIFPDETDYHQAMQNGASNWTLTIEVIVAGIDQGSQKRLDQMLAESGEFSIKAAVEADLTLGGIVSDATVTRTSGYRFVRLPSTQAPAIGAQWTVEIST